MPPGFSSRGDMIAPVSDSQPLLRRGNRLAFLARLESWAEQALPATGFLRAGQRSVLGLGWLVSEALLPEQHARPDRNHTAGRCAFSAMR